MAARIVVAGSFNADLVTYLARFPQPGETLHGRRFTTGPGGKGSNQAVAAARLGAHTTYIGCIGRDTLAEIGISLWQKEGIDFSHVARIETESTGVAVIFVDDAGQNIIAVTMGANGKLSPSDIDAAEAAIAGADFLVTQLETPLETVQHTLMVARKHSIPTMLNPAPAMQLPRDVLALADYLTPNEYELSVLVGNLPVEEAARSLLLSEQQTVIVTLGEKGARWFKRGSEGHVPAYRVAAVDTVGAGDAFNGGLAVALAEGSSLEAALKFANAVGAVSVTKYGAASSMPYRHAVETLLSQQG